MDNTSFQDIDTGLACFAIMANYFEKPMSLDQIKHKYDRQNSQEISFENLVRPNYAISDILWIALIT